MRNRIGVVVLVKMRSSLYQPGGVDRDDISHVLTISWDKRIVYNPLRINPASKNSTKLDSKVNFFTMSSVIFILLSVSIRRKISLENFSRWFHSILVSTNSFFLGMACLFYSSICSSLWERYIYFGGVWGWKEKKIINPKLGLRKT